MTRINHGEPQPGLRVPVHKVLSTDEALAPAGQIQSTHHNDFSPVGIRLDLLERRTRELEHRLADMDKAFAQLQEYTQLIAHYAATTYDTLDRYLHPEEITSIGGVPLLTQQDQAADDFLQQAQGAHITELDLDVEKRDAMGKPMAVTVLADRSYMTRLESALKDLPPTGGFSMLPARDAAP